MKVKETIAIVGKEAEQGDSVISKLAEAGYPLVLVSKQGHLKSLSGQIQEKIPTADIEMIDCEREACWEADIILISNKMNFDKVLVEKIRAVANQKILICMTGEKVKKVSFENDINVLRQELPYTKVVGVFYEGNQTINFLGDDDETADTVKSIFIAAGFTLNDFSPENEAKAEKTL